MSVYSGRKYLLESFYKIKYNGLKCVILYFHGTKKEIKT